MQTKRVGNRSEALVIAAFVARGWVVLIPFGDTEPYDIVIDRGQGFERVQIKTGHLRKGCLVFNACSIPGRKSNDAVKYTGKIDLFAVYHDGQVYLFPVDEVGSPQPMFRLFPAQNSNRHIRWAKDFLSGPVVT